MKFRQYLIVIIIAIVAQIIATYLYDMYKEEKGKV